MYFIFCAIGKVKPGFQSQLIVLPQRHGHPVAHLQHTVYAEVHLVATQCKSAAQCACSVAGKFAIGTACGATQFTQYVDQRG